MNTYLINGQYKVAAFTILLAAAKFRSKNKEEIVKIEKCSTPTATSPK